jgi:hypothetical protein
MNNKMGAGKIELQCTGWKHKAITLCSPEKCEWKNIGAIGRRKNITETANMGVSGRRKIEQRRLILVGLICKEIRWRIGTKF